jgi:two-component system response regulator AtoC
VVVIEVPPLRERKDDIALLSAHFLSEIRGQDSDESISRDALEILQRYEYPGNIRELRSILHTASNLAQGRPISEKHLPPEVRKSAMASLKAAKQSMQGVVPLAKWEKHYILKIYNQADRNKAVTARFLEIGVNTLRRKLQSYNVS